MKLKPLTYHEQLELEEQFPKDPEDVFQMYVDQEPKHDYEYWVEPPEADTIVVSLDKRKYKHYDEAKARARELFILRGLKPYARFQTARHYCWKTVKR